MAKYIIVAETGADITKEFQQQYNIQLVPMHVVFGSETKDDGAFPVGEVFSYYKKAGVLPTTSGCNVGDFEKALDEIHEKYPDHHILHLAYSAVTTCSYQSCIIASEGRDYITSIDTKQVAAGQCLIVVLTARFLEQNPDADIDMIKAYVDTLIEKCRMGFFPGDLDYLRAGGRVSNVAYLGAKILSLNPLIELLDGKLTATKKYRGSIERAASKMLPEFAAKYDLDKSILFFPFSEGLPEKTKKNIENQARELGFQEICWVQTGSVVSTHSGPGAIGVCGMAR